MISQRAHPLLGADHGKERIPNARVKIAERNAVTEAHQDLFQEDAGLPTGFRYQEDLLEREVEHKLLVEIERLPFAPFQFHGFEGKRCVVSFG